MVFSPLSCGFCIPTTTWAPCTTVDTKQSHDSRAFVTLRNHKHTLRFFGCLSLPSYPTIYLSGVVCLPLFFWLSSRHLSVVLPPPNNKCVLQPLLFYQHLFSLHHPLTQPHFTQPPVTQPVLCSLHSTPRHHLGYPPTMSHSKPFSPLTPIITPTLHDHPRTNLACSPNGMPSGFCSAYATTRSGLSSTSPPGNS
jgi:hypothetical protein